MKIEIARQDDRMAPNGAAILRSLQNASLPVLDLLVRESFQNSLDARLKNEDFVRIELHTNKIQTNEVSNYFDGITNNLNQQLPEETTVLSVADSNTTGLTGEFNTSDIEKLDESNIYKLIYGINMNQEEGDAGGSWGLGKTSFFRIGSGIVIYYTRIKNENGSYEERLAACLIEDSKKEDAVMPNNPRGIAWWGDKNSSADDYDKSYPITNKEFIHEFLKDFKLQPYKKDETGTTIIIPFINEEELTLKTEENGLASGVYWWEDSIENSLEIAIKRWYTPRLLNTSYSKVFKQPYLMTSINNSPLHVQKNEETFSIFKDLYDAAITNKSSSDNIVVKNIFLKQLGMKDTSVAVGRVAFTKVNTKQLKMKNGSELSPLAYIGEANASSKTGSKILAYSRKPGMIIEYVVDDNQWMKGVPVNEDEFVFAFFVPNSDGELHNRYHPHFKKLENYLRETENADHANWTDIYLEKYAVTIIKRIKAEVSKALADDLGESLEAISSRRTSSLSRKYGQLFMPETNFGKSGSKTKRSKDKETKPRIPKLKAGSLSIQSYQIKSDYKVSVLADISIPKNTKYNLTVNVMTTDSVINNKKWVDTFEESIPYPFELLNVEMDSDTPIYIDSDVSNNYKTYYVVNDSTNNYQSKIKFDLNIKDSTLRPTISLTNKVTTN